MLMRNNKGFTVIELIVSFLFASILSLSLFSAVIVYREKQTDTSIEADLLAFKSQLTIDIQNDIQLKGLKSIDYCPQYNNSGNLISGSIEPRCVILNFNDASSKIFKIESDKKEETIETDTFSYDVLYVLYGDIRYDIPDANNVYIEDDYILTTTSDTDSLETNTKLYKININLKHNNLDNDITITIVANGTEAYTTSGSYKSYNVGNDVTIQVNRSKQLNFKVIEKSNTFQNTVTLLYNDVYDDNLVFNSTEYNNLENLGNRYKTSSIRSKIAAIESDWSNVEEVRLITVDEIARISSFCPQYRGIDSPDVSLATSPDWLTNKSYWTMSEKLTSGDSNGKKVWVVNGNVLTGDFVNANYALRPVIVVNKAYITN